MKLYELKELDYDLYAHFTSEFDNTLAEGIGSLFQSAFSKVAKTFSEVYSKANTKSGMNDIALRKIYLEELDKLKSDYKLVPDKIKQKLTPILEKHSIKIDGGIDLSRKNLNRILVIKIVRALLWTASQMRDNGILWFLSAAVSGGVAAIIGMLMAAKDYKSLGQEMISSSKQIKSLIDKANEPPNEPPNRS